MLICIILHLSYWLVSWAYVRGWGSMLLAPFKKTSLAPFSFCSVLTFSIAPFSFISPCRNGWSIWCSLLLYAWSCFLIGKKTNKRLKFNFPISHSCLVLHMDVMLHSSFPFWQCSQCDLVKKTSWCVLTHTVWGPFGWNCFSRTYLVKEGDTAFWKMMCISIWVVHRNPFHEKYPHSFNDLFLRVWLLLCGHKLDTLSR